MDYPELVDSLHRLLGAEEAKPCPQGTESVALSGRSHLATGATPGGSSYRPEASSASTSRFLRARANLSETQCSSAEESILAGSCHDARAGRRSQRLGPESPFSSTPELLRPQSTPSPESALRSRSALSFSTLSSEENILS
ncbi:hypothetical protein N322_06933, partial [Cariama cristata]